MRFQIEYVISHTKDPEEKIHLILGVLAGEDRTTPALTELDDIALGRIVIREGSTSYLTHEVDADNKAGFFQEYKKLARRIATVLQEVNPTYPFPLTLVSTILETARKQMFFAEHLPSLTEASESDNSPKKIREFLEHTVLSSLSHPIMSVVRANS